MNDIDEGAWRLVFGMIEAGVNGDDPCRDDGLSVFMSLKGIPSFMWSMTMMNITYYKLIGRLAVPCHNAVAWARWFETAQCRVAETNVGPLWVSTVFLGLDHNFSGRGRPLLFETIIFDGHAGGEGAYQERSATWDDAERCHAEAVEVARRRLAAALPLLERTHEC